MKQHTKNYFKHFGIAYNETGWHDTIFCEHCGKVANDIHHIEFRSQGGSDDPENLIALCRRCHGMAHNGELTKDDLRLIHRYKLMVR